jgi:hypothetical protein
MLEGKEVLAISEVDTFASRLNAILNSDMSAVSDEISTEDLT